MSISFLLYFIIFPALLGTLTFPRVEVEDVDLIFTIVSLDSGEFGLFYSVSGTIYFEIYDEDGVQQQAQTLLEADALSPKAIRQPDGDVIVAFMIEEQGGGNGDEDGKGVFMRKCTPTLDCSGLNIQVNADKTGDQEVPFISAYPDGSFTVCYIQRNPTHGINCRSYDEDLTPYTDELIATNLNTFSFVRVQALPDYTYVVVYYGPGALSGLYFQIRSFEGDTIVKSSHLITPTGTQSGEPRITILPNDNFAIIRRTWNPTDFLSVNIYNKTHDIDYKILTTVTTGDQFYFGEVELANGSVLVAWASGEDGTNRVYLETFDEDFNSLRPKKIISATDASEIDSRQAELALTDDEVLGFCYRAEFAVGLSPLIFTALCTKNSHCSITTPFCDYTECLACDHDFPCEDGFPEYPVCNTGTGGCIESLEITVTSDFDSICSTGNFVISVQSSIITPSINFNVYSVSNHAATLTALDAALPDGSVSGTFVIDINDFQPEDTYTFEAVSTVTESTPFSMIASELFSLLVSQKSFVITKNQSISSSSVIETCMDGRPMSVDWTQIDGPALTITDYTAGDGTQVEVDACELEAHSEYEFQCEVYFDEYPATKKIYSLFIGLTNWPFSVEIDNEGNDEIFAHDSITFTSSFHSDCAVDDPNDLLYKWSCLIGSSENGPFTTACDDPDNLFEVYLAGDNELTLTEDYYNPGQFIRINSTIKLGEDEQVSSPKVVKILSYLDLQLDSPELRCSIKLSANIDEYEYQFQNQFQWLQTNNPSSTQALNEYLSTKTVSSIIISTNLIEVGATYHFSSSYVSFTGDTITDEIELIPIPELPVLSFSGGSSQDVVSFSNLRIKAQADCMPDGLEIEWTQTSGPTLQLEDFIIQEIPTELFIPKCTLEVDQSYQFQIELTATNSGEQSQYQIDVNVVPDTFRVSIENGDTHHLETEDLELSAVLIPEGDCEIQGQETITFEWECYKTDNDRDVTSSACDDPEDIFEVPSVNNAIKIPESYFENRNTLQIVVKAVNGAITKEYTTIIKITDQNVLKLSLGCESSSSCFVFSPQKSYRFMGKLGVSSASFTDLSSLWSIDPSFAHESFLNRLKTQPVLEQLSPSDFSLPYEVSIFFIASNETHKSSSEYLIPLNFAPHLGSFGVKPARGKALFRQFALSAPGWTDDNIPLSYQYFFGVGDEGSLFRALSDKTSADSFETILTSKKPQSSVDKEITLKVDVIDPYDAKTSDTTYVTLFFPQLTTEQSIAELTNIMDSIKALTDPLQQIQQLSLLSFHITGIDESIDINDEECSDCSGNGRCSNGVCTCDEGFLLDHCQLSRDDFDSITDAKQEILDLLQSELELIEDENLPLDIIQDVSSSSTINTDNTIQTSKDILDQQIQISNSSHILQEETSIKTAQIVDNMMSYTGKNDCKAEGNITKDLKETAKDYISKFTQGLLADKIPGEEALTIENDQFQMISQKLTECSILNVNNFKINDKVPGLSAGKTSNQSLDCSKEVSFSYLAFKGNIFDCDADANSKEGVEPILIVTIFDEEGEDKTSDYSFYVEKFKDSDSCLEGCEESGEGCHCKPGESAIFDLGGQIARIFSNSNLRKLADSKAFEGWKLYNNGVFWIVFSLTAILGATVLVITKYKPEYCLIENVTKQSKVSGFQGFMVGFVLFHPLLNVYFINAIQPTKLFRAFIFYTRALMMLGIVCILGQNSGFSFSRRLQEISISLDVYILLIPYITFVPMEMLLGSLLTKRKISQNSSKYKKCLLKFIKIFGISLMCILILGFLYLILAISENSSHDEQIEFIALFGRVLAQDWILTPLLLILIMYIIQDKHITKIMTLSENSKSQPQNHSQQAIASPIKRIKKNKIMPLDSELDNNLQANSKSSNEIKNLLPQNQGEDEGANNQSSLRRLTINEKEESNKTLSLPKLNTETVQTEEQQLVTENQVNETSQKKKSKTIANIQGDEQESSYKKEFAMHFETIVSEPNDKEDQDLIVQELEKEQKNDLQKQKNNYVDSINN